MIKRGKLEAAMNVESMYLFELQFSLDICPGVGPLHTSNSQVPSAKRQA